MVTDPAGMTPPRRWPRRLAWAAIAAAGVFLLAVLILPRFIDVNTYRPLIQSRAEQALGRPVSLGEMSLSVFPGVAIRVENPEVQGLLRARSLKVGVRLLPLLRGAVELRHVVLIGPELTLERRADGTWSAGSAPGGAAGSAEPASPAQEPGSRAATSFSLSRLVVEDGLAHLTLHTPGGEIVRQDLSLDLQGSVSGEGLSRLAGEFRGRAAAEGIDVAASGSFARAETETSFEMSLEEASLEVGRLRRLAQAAGMAWPLPEGVIGQGEVTATGTLAGRFPAAGPARVEVRDARVEGLDLALARDTQGRWNIASLWEPAAGAGPAGAEAPAQALEMEIHDARVERARVRLRDASVGGAAGAADLTLDGVSLHVREMAPGKPIDLTLSARVAGGGSLRAEGTIPASLAAEASLDARVTLDRIPVGPVAPWLVHLAGVGARDGTVSTKFRLSGRWPDRVRVEGNLSVDDLLLAAARHPIDARAEFDLAALDAAARTEVASLRAATGGSEVELRGWIDNREGATRVDIQVLPASVQPADVLDLLAVAGAGLPVEFSSPRPIQMEARVQGEISPRRQLDLAGRLSVADATFRHASMTEPLRNVQGTITLRGEGFEVSGFSASIGGSDVAGTLAVQGFDAPRATFQLTSRRADFWELLSFMRQPEAPSAPGAPPAPAPGGTAAGPGLMDRISARGTLQIGQGTFGSLDFARLSATLTLDGRMLRLEPVDMALYGGDVSGSAGMDLRSEPPVYSVSTEIRGVDTDALLADNLGMKGTLAGALSGNLSVRSTGSSRDEALRRATGGGDVRLDNGRVGPINVLKVLSRASDVLGERSLEEISGKLASEGTEFSVLTATLVADGGKIRTDNLHMVSPDLELKDDGTLDMMAATIQIAGEILLSEQISLAMQEEESKAADYFWDARRNRVNLPLRLSGPIAAPQPSIDWSTAGGNLARRRIEERLREKLGDRPLDKLLGRKGEPPAGESAAGEPRRAPPAAPADPTGQVQPARSAEGPAIVVDEKRFSGNLLKPDLRIKGSLRGVGLQTASVLVKSERGEVLHQESLEERIAAYYATADRGQPATISFRLTLESRRAMGLGDDVLVTITVQDDQGRAAENTFRVER